MQWVFHTYQVIEQSSELLTLLKDAETDQRGYLITGDSTYVQPLETLRQKIQGVTDSMKSLVNDNPHQAQLLQEEILPRITSKLAELEKVTTIHHQHGRDSAFAYLQKGRGRAVMDSLQSSVSQFSAQEKFLLRERLEEEGRTHRKQIILRYTSFSVIAFVSFIALVTIVKKQRSNDELIGKLNDANQNLEHNVRERTLELEKKTRLAEKLSHDLQENLEEMESFYEALQIKNAGIENTLREIRDLYDNAPCGYHSLAPDGLVVRMNETELRWLGYKREEVVGKMNIKQLIKPEEHETYQNDFIKFKQEGSMINVDRTFVSKDGRMIQALVNSTAIYDPQGRYVMSRSTITDISQQKKIEQNLIEANRNLIHLNEDKNHFLAIAAHDLKSPLNSILGLINLMNLGNSNLRPEQQEYLRYIQRSCSNMQTLITNLLDINKIEQGVNVLNPETIELGELLQAHISIFQERAMSKNITLLLEDNAPGKTITTDVVSLQRIIENLLSNAIKFSPKDKTVMMRVIHNHASVEIEVIDQGQGITPDEMPRLFKKYQRLSARPTGGEGSTGLGLSIVKELVNALKGKIRVESEVNKGSKFVVELPLAS